ncbi:MAG TPA: hypothetical protein VNM92_06860 [Thermoanaerobaculia bacterium]|nr:hypothetical protein [Thermoanaerobaculia bacterium]
MRVPLRGVSDTYNFILQPSDDNDEPGLRVRSSGFNPREGWLNAEIRAAVSNFYEVSPRNVALNVEAATLMCHTVDRLEGAVVRARISRLIPVAGALERTL